MEEPRHSAPPSRETRTEDTTVATMRERCLAVAEIIREFEAHTGKCFDAFRYDDPAGPEMFFSFARPAAGQTPGTNAGP